ncbi:MAG: hypothetical protein AUK34_10190 [Ignavibacteria bacterium CG2_30_36_16]|nr:MAG: hypothetical protein AUK34_10190 [Ignavibacteria bacterium CG2_30_36_16]
MFELNKFFNIQNNGAAEILVDDNSFCIRENDLKKFFKLKEKISYKSIAGKLISESSQRMHQIASLEDSFAMTK